MGLIKNVAKRSMLAGFSGSSWALRQVGALSTLKKLNRARIEQHIARRDTALTSFPLTLQVEHTTVCNLRCRMCSITRPTRNRPAMFLDEGVIERLRPVLPYVTDVKLNGGGEPFVVPEIENFLEVFGEYGVELTTTTNATRIDEARARLIGETFRTLIVSMDGATKDTYDYVRVNGDFDVVMDAFDRLNRHRGPQLELIIGFVCMRCNMHELPDLVRLAHERNVQQVHANWMVPFPDLPWTHDQDPALDPEAANRWLREAREVAEELGVGVRFPSELRKRPAKPLKVVEGPALDVDEAPVKRTSGHIESTAVEGYCHIMYDRAMVLADGRVKPCCHSSEIMGNVLETDFEQIWNTPAYQQLRASFNGGTLPTSCSKCNFLRSDRLPGARLIPQ